MSVTNHGFKPGGYAFYDIESLDIAAWSPDDKAQTPPTQVHLEIKVRGLKAPLVMRFKSPTTIGLLIEQLSRYRQEAWPEDARREQGEMFK